MNWCPKFGVLPKLKDADREKLMRKREKQKAKDDSKLEKQRRLKEEKLRKVADKEKERDKKKQQKLKQKSASASGIPSKIADFIQVGYSVFPQMLFEFEHFSLQSDKNYVPLFLEKCVRFIEDEGLDSEGIYRVPGNRAHVDLLFQKFDEGTLHPIDFILFSKLLLNLSDANIQIHELDIPVNAVATALKDFVSKRLPPLFEEDIMNELEEIAGKL